MNDILRIQNVHPHVWEIRLPSRTLPPFNHTNSYLIVSDGVGMWVEMGATEPEALDVVEEVLEQAGVHTLKALLLTHTHPDHAAGAALFCQRFAVPCYVHPLEIERIREHFEQAGETVEFIPLEGKRRLMVGNLVLETLHTPGHAPGHLCFHLLEEQIIIAGDMVSGHSSIWVGMPEGNVQHYLDSLALLAQLEPRLLAPAHGDVILEPQKRLAEMRQHRLKREADILEKLQDKPLSLSELRQAIYARLPSAKVEDLAERSLLAHLIKLMQEMRVVHMGDDQHGPFALRT